jgi:ribonuclease HI
MRRFVIIVNYKMMIIFTDGSSRGNPGPGGWGAILAGDDRAQEIGGREDDTTNNRMELTAVISALKISKGEREVTIYTDSAYVLNGITRWVKGWVKNKWVTSQKENVLNRDLWEKLISQSEHRVIFWKLVKGHSGHSGNERCDIIATSFADNNPVILFNGSRERYGVNIREVVEAKSKNNRLIGGSPMRRKAYSYVSLVNGEIKVHKTWEECKKRVTGLSGVKFKKTTSPEDEQNIIREFQD